MKKTRWKKLTAMILSLALAIGMAVCVTPSEVSAATKKLTSSEKKAFAKYLKGYNIDDGWYSYDFYLYDVNGDGRKDLIVGEEYGTSKIVPTTHVYMHIGKKYVECELSGDIEAVSGKGEIKTSYRGNGASPIGEFCSWGENIYRISSKGKVTLVMSYDGYANENIITGETEESSDNYYINSKETTEKKYNAKLKKYTFKTVKVKKSYNLTTDNIKKVFGS